MNIKLNLEIPFKDSSKTLRVSADTLLEPFYVTEKELLSMFLEEYSDRFVKGAREIIFYSSIKANETLKLKLLQLEVEEELILRRQLTLCYSIIAFGNKFNSDFIKSMSRSKTLGDFTVSTSLANDTSFLSNTIKDARTCVDDLLKIIEELNAGNSIIRSFVKGKLNSMNATSDRLWLHRGLPITTTDSHASLKKQFNGRYYKSGGNFATKS